MNAFNKRTARRIGAVSLLLALLASPLSWFVVRQNVEQSTVALAIEESQRLLGHFGAIALSGPGAASHADSAAKALAGGLFDIAEIYDGQGQRLAEAMTSNGLQVEGILLHHATPNYKSTRYESVNLPDRRWVLRVFVPLRLGNVPESEVTGYFEGVRIVPEWQRQRMLSSALSAALMAGLASLLCGLAIYPVVVRLSADNERKALEVLDSHISMMEALGRAIAKRDSETGAHNYRVAWIAGSIAEKFGFRGSKMQSLIVGSFLHDVGKIGIPDAILLKPGPLDRDELAIMQHMSSSAKRSSPASAGLGANEVVAGHHERWDGTGYPRRLKGEHIPLAARIFAVADVFDALCSRRPYKEPMNFETVMEILERESGSHFDPDVMTEFRPMARKIFDHLADCSEEAASKMLEGRVRKHYGL
jgi:HD-GYP domain-containing protein (c-di-GMP phosphodiesterase class II)